MIDSLAKFPRRFAVTSLVGLLCFYTFDASAATDFQGGNVTSSASWSNGLPAPGNPGTISVDGSVNASPHGYPGATVDQSAGTITANAFNFTSGIWNLSGGRIEARFVLANGAAGAGGEEARIHASGGTIFLNDVTGTQQIGVANSGFLTVSGSAILDASQATAAVPTNGTIDILSDWTGFWKQGNYSGSEWKDHFTSGEILSGGLSISGAIFDELFDVSPDGTTLARKSGRAIAGSDFSTATVFGGSGGDFDSSIASTDDIDPADGISVSGWSFANGGSIIGAFDNNAQVGMPNDNVTKINGAGDGSTLPAIGSSGAALASHSFTLTIPADAMLDLDSVSFDWRSATDSNNVRWLAFDTSLDPGITFSKNGQARPAFDSESIDLSGPLYQGLTGTTITFNFYAGGQGSGDIDIDTIIVNGTTFSLDSEFQISTYAIAGGGGKSSSSAGFGFSVVGTVGQPVVDKTSSPGGLAIETGFWWADSNPYRGQYDEWARGLVASGLDADFGADGDFDGVSNGMAYLFGPAGPFREGGRISAGGGVGDTDLTLFVSDDLVQWDPVLQRTAGVRTFLDPGFSIVGSHVIDLNADTETRRFYRYEATLRD